MITKISKGQQITIPAKYRSKLNLKVGSKVEIEIKGKEIIIKPIGVDLEELFEKAKKIKPKKHLTAEEMDKLTENEVFG